MSAFNNEKLKEMRKQAGYTQAKLALMIGVARTTYAEYEQGKIQPPLDKVERICRLFNINSSEFMNVENNTGVDITKVHFKIKMSDEDKILRIKRLQQKESVKKAFDNIFEIVNELDFEEKQIVLPLVSYISKKYEFTASEEEMMFRISKGMK